MTLCNSLEREIRQSANLNVFCTNIIGIEKEGQFHLLDGKAEELEVDL